MRSWLGLARAAKGAGAAACALSYRLFFGVVAIALLAVPWLPARAETVHPGGVQYNFGDSNQDVNYLCPYGYRAFTTTGACSNNRNAAQQLGVISNYAFVAANDYAVGGAASGDGILIAFGIPAASIVPYPTYPSTPFPIYPNLLGQIEYFQSLNQPIGPNDLVALTYGADAGRYFPINPPPPGTPPLSGKPLGDLAANFIATGVQDLIAAGGRNFILRGGLPFDIDYYKELTTKLPQLLSPLESTTLHIRIFDIITLVGHAFTHPHEFGYANALDCSAVPGCLTGGDAVQNQHITIAPAPGGVGHFTDSFSLIVARYLQTLLTSADGVTAQAKLGATSMATFHDALSQRLDLVHAGVPRPPADLAASSEASSPYEAEPGQIDFFVQGSYERGHVDDRQNADGYRFSAGGVMLGADYHWTANRLLGLSASYSRPTADLNGLGGSISTNAYMMAGYGALSYPHWFADLVMAGGIDRYKVRRPGVIDVLTASPEGNVIAPSLKGGYVFDLPYDFQLGPIAAVAYSRTSVDRYREHGDSLLTQTVSAHTFESLADDLGLQLRRSSAFGVGWLVAFLNLTAEHQFFSDPHVLTTINTDPVSALPIYTRVSSATPTYGRIEGGVSVDILRRLHASLEAASTFARTDGTAYGVQGTLSYRF